jgi:DNA-binding transcriptional MerR regulator
MPEDSAVEHAYMQIGEVAERTGLTPRTLRYYEEKGLLSPPTRMEGGFRLYSDDDIARVERIKQLRDLLGFSLADIKDMIAAEEVKQELRRTYRQFETDAERLDGMRNALRVTEHQLTLIEQKIASLQEMRDGLHARAGRYREFISSLTSPAE